MARILLLTLEFPPDRGGVARYYGGLVGAMPAGSVVVLKAQLSRWMLPRWLPLLWRVWRTVRRETITEILVGHILPLGTITYLLKRLSIVRCPVTVFTHGMDILVPQSSRRKTLLMKKILGVASRVVTISQFTKRELLKLGVPEEKIVIVPPCPTIKNFESRISGFTLRKKYHLENKKILLTVARLVERKGIDLVIEALRNVEIPGFAYVVVGDGPEKEKFQLRITHYALPVILVGAVGDDELAAWYEACDAFIMTPRTIGPDVEGFGLVYLEANAVGKPVIGSRSGGVPEAVVDGETGLLVDESDVDGIANAIRRLLSDEAFAKKLGERGRSRVEHEFQWDEQVKRLL